MVRGGGWWVDRWWMVGEWVVEGGGWWMMDGGWVVDSRWWMGWEVMM